MTAVQLAVGWEQQQGQQQGQWQLDAGAASLSLASANEEERGQEGGTDWAVGQGR